MTLIERLRQEGKYKRESPYAGLCDEAADELERLQSHIAAMTKDMDSLEKQLEMADAAIERWKTENEELRKDLANEHELAEQYARDYEALKASTEQPVAWRVKSEEFEDVITDEGDVDFYIQNAYKVTPLYTHPPKQESTEPVAWLYETHYYPESRTIQSGVVLERGVDTDRTDWTPLYTTPPQATALVADFKRRAIEVCMNKAKVVTQLNYAGGCEWCAEAIESMPLIGEKHDRTD